MPVLTDLLSPFVLSAEAEVAQLSAGARLLPEEEQAIARAVASRRAQYTLARSLARQLFRRAGLPELALLNRADRSPIWPSGFVGSVTHTEEWCGVVLAKCEQLCGVGIDAERLGRIDRAIAERVLVEGELAWVDRTPAPMDFATLLFSAKESVYKCIHPTVGRYVGFEEVEIALALDAGCFRVNAKDEQLEREHGGLLRELRGRFVRRGDHWITSCEAAPGS